MSHQTPPVAGGSLSRLPAYDPETSELTAVVETPKGSRNKYDYDPGCAAFRLGGVLPEGMSFPYDFGFIPSTLGDDGDPLDVLILLDTAVVVGCVLTVRPIGVIEAEQRERDGTWNRNDRLVAVATHARTHEHVRALGDLRPRLLDEVEAFFAHYNRLSGKEFKPTGRGGPERARELVDRGIAATRREEGGEGCRRVPARRARGECSRAGRPTSRSIAGGAKLGGAGVGRAGAGTLEGRGG